MVPPMVPKIARLLPPIFSVPLAQPGPQPTQVADCVSGKAVAGTQFSVTVLSFKGITTEGGENTFKDSASTVNFAGNDGDNTPEKFIQTSQVAAAPYKAIKINVSPTLTIKGQVTCSSAAWGGASRTYYTDGTLDFDNGDPCVSADADSIQPNGPCTAGVANPVAAQLDFGGGSGTAQTVELPVTFTVFAGGATDLNLAVKNEGAFVLWNISAITPAVEAGNAPAIKVFPGAPDTSEGVSQVSQTGP